jgi:phage-related protein
MKVTINGLQLGDDTDYQIEAPVAGLEKPGIRTSSQRYSGRDGGRVNGQYLDPRLITIPGFFNMDTCADHEAARQELDQALPVREELDIEVELPSGDTFVTSGYIQDFKMPYRNTKRSDYKIDLFCGDSNLYIGEELTATLNRFVGGGFTLPVTLPIVFAPGSGLVAVNNTGYVEVYPVLEINGSATNPEITKVSTGEKVEVGVTMSGGDQLIIDMKRRTITLNGGSVLGLRTSDSDWFALDVGSNPLRYDTTDGADTGVVTVRWRTAVTGI